MHIVIQVQDKKDKDKPLFPELNSKVTGKGVVTHCGILQGGMASGKTSLWFHIETEDGQGIGAELSFDMLDAIWHAVRGAEERWATGNN